MRFSSLENSARSGIVKYCFSANLDSSLSNCSLEKGVRGLRSRLCLLRLETRVGLFSSDFGGDFAGFRDVGAGDFYLEGKKYLSLNITILYHIFCFIVMFCSSILLFHFLNRE